MIKVLAIKSKNNKIHHVSINGHADFAEKGSDIVCSAVSALTLGIVNSVETLLGIDLQPEQNDKKSGFLSWSVPVLEDENIEDQLQLLMKVLIESLLMIEEKYNKYLIVEIETS